jgi:Zn-dependent protease with chaperone function
MTTGVRAAIAVSMLAGFYVLALAIAAGLAIAGIEIAANVNGGVHFVVVLLAAALAIVVGLVKALRRPAFQPNGVRLDEHDQPHVWAMVRELADRIVTRPPDEIWLVPDVNAAVTEDASLLGLRGGRRYLLIGLPLLLTLTTEQLCAVLCHELGHYSHAHTRLGEINYRGRITIGRTIEQLQDGSFTRTVVRRVFELYAQLYFLVESAVSRQQELEADEAAGEVVGRLPMQTALRELPALDTAWNFYLRNYVGWALDYKIAPKAVFAGFPAFLKARQRELVQLRRRELDEASSRWDTHPSTASRIAALELAPDRGVISDRRPAWTLVTEVQQLMEELEHAVLDFGDRDLLDWEAYTAQGVLAGEQRSTDAMFRALSRVTGRTPESFETVFAYAEAGRFGELQELLARANAPERGLSAALTVAAVRSDMVQVRHWWDRSPTLAFADGEEFSTRAILETLESGPQGARRVRNWLRQVGIDIGYATPSQAQADAGSAQVVGAMANVKVAKQQMDLVISDEGLVFTPCPRSAKNGRQRLTGLLSDTSVADLAARPGSRWVPFEEIATATLHRSTPVIRATVTLFDGSTIAIQETLGGEHLGKSDQALEKILSDLAERG